MSTERDQMSFDVVIVGAGPAGLSAAIKLKQLAQAEERELSVCVVEKGSEVGAHILSGAVIDPISLSELFPDWQALDAPLTRTVTADSLRYLTAKRSIKLPTPPTFHNKGNYIISLGVLTRWLAEQAEALEVEIYPGFAAAEVLYDDNGAVIGIATGDMGIGKDGKPSDNYEPGMELLAKQTLFAEGCRGSLSQLLIKQYALDKDSQAQTYGIGIKEVWEVPEGRSQAGLVEHTVGWPLDSKTYGGSFVYHLDDNQIALGMVVGLDYQNPYLSPFAEMQRLKTHPHFSALLEGGKRIAYGARALIEGGVQSLPKLTFPGGVLIGDAAGFLNVPRIKGIHCAMKSAMLAAEAVYPLTADEDNNGAEATAYSESFKQSWLYKELYSIRNVRPSFKWGFWGAMSYSALETYLLRYKAPWTLKHHGADHLALKKAANAKKIDYPKPDGKLTFDRLSSVFLTATNHEEEQPSHLTLKDAEQMIRVNYEQYASPETRYCPAAVYEIIEDGDQPTLAINAQNCIHCKTCDIKDVTQNIVWRCPEGGGGPNYGAM